MYFVYSIVFFFLLLVYFPFYFVRAKFIRNENLYLKDRFGFNLPEATSKEKSLWIHAVSVGEVLSLQNLIKKIKEKHPCWTMYFSTVTTTGMQMARKKLKEIDRIFFIPLDFTFIIKKYFKRLKPQVFIIAESEFWPNLLKEAKKQTNGVLLINGRISAHSFKHYYRFRFLTKKVLNNIDFFLVQTEKDKDYLEKIGLNLNSIRITGNLKSEINLSTLSEKEILKLKKDLSIQENQRVFIAGSTRRGEEKRLLESFAKAKSITEDIVLILAPRHLERVKEIEKLCESFSFKVVRRTSVSSGMTWDVLILDTIGELTLFYALADVAFIGGSLVPWGGQNLLEPAFYKKPIFFGTHMDNFSYLAKKFVESGAGRIIHNNEDLLEMFLFKNEKTLKQMGNRAKIMLNSLQGATDKTLKVIEKYIRGN